MNETRYAGVAQLVEQLICNQQVGGSSPSTSSTISASEYGRFPEWPKGADCKSVVNDFGGSNPPPPTKEESTNLCSLLFCAENKKARVRANLKSHVSWYQPSLSLCDISPKGRDKFGLRVRANKFAPVSRLSLRESWHLRSK